MKKLLLLLCLMGLCTLGVCQEQSPKLGSVPKVTHLKTNEACRAHFEEVYEASLYYVNHYNSGGNEVEDCRSLVIDYCMVSEDMVFAVGPQMTKIAKETESAARMLFTAAMAGYVIYMHDHPEEDHKNFSEAAYIYSWSTMLDYYESNRKMHMGPTSKTLDAYIKAFEKGTDKYLEMVKKDFKQYKKQSQKS